MQAAGKWTRGVEAANKSNNEVVRNSLGGPKMEQRTRFDATLLRRGVGSGGARLSVQMAEALLENIRANDLPAGTRLPSEKLLSERFGVSRTVVREAIATLQADGLVEPRRGSGTFVRRHPGSQTLRIESLEAKSIEYLLHLIEVRRSMEAEMAALAAERRSPQQLAKIVSARIRREEAVAAGREGVEEELDFHLGIAQATNNPYWVKVMGLFVSSIRTAVRLLRANEARRTDFTEAPNAEHARIVEAIRIGDAAAAREAGAAHMDKAAERVRAADREFWTGEGGKFARKLVKQY